MSELWNDAKEKIQDAAEKVQEKAAPVVEKVRDGVSDAVDAVRDGLRRAGGSGPEVDNPLFDELDAQVRAQKSEAQARAEEMQRMLERMRGGGKEEYATVPALRIAPAGAKKPTDER